MQSCTVWVLAALGDPKRAGPELEHRTQREPLAQAGGASSDPKAGERGAVQVGADIKPL